MTPGYLFHSASFWQSFFKIIQGAPLAGTASFSVFACAAFGAPFHQDFIPLHKSSDHPTSAMCRPFPRSLISILPNGPAAEKVRHDGHVGCRILSCSTALKPASFHMYPFRFNRKRFQLWHKKSLPFSFFHGNHFIKLFRARPWRQQLHSRQSLVPPLARPSFTISIHSTNHSAIQR